MSAMKRNKHSKLEPGDEFVAINKNNYFLSYFVTGVWPLVPSVLEQGYRVHTWRLTSAGHVEPYQFWAPSLEFSDSFDPRNWVRL